MNRKRKITHLILIILTLVFIVGIGYFLFENQNQKLFSERDLKINFTRDVPPEIPKLSLPKRLEESQLAGAQKIDDTYFVKFLKSSINIPVASPIQRSGMLYAKEKDPSWKIFYEIKDLATKDISSYKNNPYQFWKEGETYLTVIVDSSGAGSGEGLGKLISIDTKSKKWKVENCFFYVPENYEAYVLNSSKNEPLSQILKNYNDPILRQYNGDFVYDTNINKFRLRGEIEEGCTLFELSILPND